MLTFSDRANFRAAVAALLKMRDFKEDNGEGAGRGDSGGKTQSKDLDGGKKEGACTSKEKKAQRGVCL